MALSDILEALTAGASAGYGTYTTLKEREREEEERERIRQEAAAERERIRKEDQAARAAEAAEARKFQLAIAGFTPSTEAEAMGEPIAARAPELGRLLEEFGPTQIAAPGAIPAPRTRSDIASALAVDTKDGRMDSGAMVAPGQTYSAIDRALAEADQPRPAPDRARVVMEQGPAPQALRGPSARERGMDFLEVDDRFYTRPGERMLAEEKAARDLETEEALARIKAEIEREELEKAVANVQAAARKRGVDLTPEEAMSVVDRSVPFSALVQEPTRPEDEYPGLTTLRRGIDAAIRRGTVDVVPSRLPKGDPVEVERPFTANETVDFIEQQSRLYNVPPEILYPDYSRLVEEVKRGSPLDPSRSSLLQQSIESQGQSYLIDPELENELELMFDQDTMAPRPNEVTTGQQRSRRNFATDNYLTRG